MGKTEISDLLNRCRTKKIEEKNENIKVKFDELVKMYAPKDFEICIKK